MTCFKHVTQKHDKCPVHFPVRVCALNLLYISVFHDAAARRESRCVVGLLIRSNLRWKNCIRAIFLRKIERIDRPTRHVLLHHQMKVDYDRMFVENRVENYEAQIKAKCFEESPSSGHLLYEVWLGQVLNYVKSVKPFRKWDHELAPIGKVKAKVTVLSPHPGSELCSADFDKYLPWSWGLYNPNTSIWISISTPWGVYSRSHETWRHGLQVCPHRYPFALGSREAMQSEKPCSGAHRADAHQGIEPGTWPRS